MSAQNISKPTSVGFLMQKSQFIRLKPASSQISELLIMKSYFEHLSNKKHFFKNHYWENPQNPFKNLQNKKKTKEIFPLSFYFLQRKTHPLESMAKCTLREKKISFSCCSRFLLSVLWKSVWLSAHPLFRGSSRYFQSNWQSLDSQGSYSGLKYCPICTESCCILRSVALWGVL